MHQQRNQKEPKIKQKDRIILQQNIQNIQKTLSNLAKALQMESLQKANVFCNNGINHFNNISNVCSEYIKEELRELDSKEKELQKK